MRQWVKYGIVGTITVLFFLSCKKDKTTVINFGYNYFPNSTGHWVIYDVDSIVVNQLSSSIIDTFQYQVKEVLDSFTTDNTGQPTQVLIRYKRLNDTAQWVYQKTWTANLTKTEALRKEDGITYVKLTFPVKLNASWDGNAFNTIGQWMYQYTSVDDPLTINTTYFDSTLTVLQDSNLNLVQHQFYIEKYARNTGRIYKKIIDLEQDSIVFPDSLALPGLIVTPTLMKKLNSGSIIYTETYNSSGN